MKQIFFIALLAGMVGNAAAQISGHLQTYVSGTTQLRDNKDQGFGVWTSLSTGVATVGSKTGLVTGVANGTANIVYSRSGVSDTAAVYVSTSDSSGYYLGSPVTKLNDLELRDYDGVTVINAWDGTYNSSGTGFNKVAQCLYIAKTDIYQITFTGIFSAPGVNVKLEIQWNKLFNSTGANLSTNRMVALVTITSYGF